MPPSASPSCSSCPTACSSARPPYSAARPRWSRSFDTCNRLAAAKCCLRALILAGLLGGGALAALAEDPLPAGGEPLPSDAELEAAGARIGTIVIQTREIFDLSDPKQNNWLFRAADRLHVRTRESAVRAQLLFRSGDPYSRHLLDETARNLRQNATFMREPEIMPVRYHDGLVDILVVTHDVWTLQPGIDYGRSGGTNTVSADVTDDNFLGYGKYIELGHGRNVDRSSTYAQWADPNVWGSRWQDSLLYEDNSDGRVWNVAANYPFYSLETRYDGGGTTGDSRSVVTRYDLGNPFDAYRFDWRVTDVYLGRALRIDESWTERLLLGFRHDQSQFSSAPSQTLRAPLPADRDLAYPYVRMQWLQNHYSTTRNLELLAFTEDVHLGLDAGAGLGWAAPAFGADRRAVLADAEIGYNWRFGPGHYLFLYGRLYSRFEYGRADDGMVSGNASYFLTTSARSKLLVHVFADAGHNLDADHYLEIGGDTGLRGYPLRYQNGAGRAQFTIEERLYTDWFLFQLVHVGGAAFLDVGRTWGASPLPAPQLGTLEDAGVGLRLGNARSSFGSVIHIDLATPLAANHSINRLQILVSTQQTF
ncbi:MAG TPA: hypothetical protein VIX87_10315 [Steroidobacteraceae bacterium]